MPPFDAYVICTSPRSGSTLLCKLLAATGVAGNPGSYFHEPSVAAWRDYFGLCADPAMSERAALAEIFRAAIETGTQATGIFGLRLQRHSVDFFLRKLAVLHPEHTADAARIEAAFGRTLFIHLTRADKIAQAVSCVKAEQTGLWHKAPDGTEIERLAPPAEPFYDDAAISAEVERFKAFDLAWDRWFEAERIAPLRLTYAALSMAPAETLREILVRLGRDPAAADGVEPGVVRLADHVNDDWIERFRRDAASC